MAELSCEECQKHIYEIPSGLPQGEEGDDGKIMLVPRPPGLPSPCERCPKGGPENEKLFQITRKNKRFLDLYRRSKDDYFEMPEHLKDCKLRQDLFYAIDQIEESRGTNNLANKLAVKLSKFIKPI